MNKLLKEAIADAKAVRETALANAKIALEEAFTPRLQSMISARLAEEEDGMEDTMDDMDDEEIPAPAPAEEGYENDEDGTPDPGPAIEEEDDMDGVDEELDLEAIIRELEGEDEETTNEAEDEEMTNEAEDKDEEIKEAYRVIKFMQSKLNEVNLLNAKLLFSNKLFRNYELNESQKMKVIENFDRAGNTREVKLVFSTLAESFNRPQTKKKMVKESYASKPVRTTAPSKPILNEGFELADRWKKLAGLL